MPTKDNKYALTGWGQQPEELTDLTVPSGQLCQVRQPGPQALLSLGLLDKLDSLTGIVHTDHIARVKGEVVPAEDITKDPVAIASALDMMDRIVCYVVVQPAVLPAPATEAERVEGTVYVDKLELNDRMFVMQFAMGGSSDLATFREKSSQATRNLADVKEISQKPKRTTRPKASSR